MECFGINSTLSRGVAGPSNSCCVPVLLDIMSFPRTKSSSHDLTYILGVSSAGLLLYWEFSGKEAKAQVSKLRRLRRSSA